MDLDPFFLAGYIVPLFSLSAGVFLFFHGVLSKPDDIWRRFVEQQQIKGLTPQRTPLAERNMRVSRVLSIMAGCVFILGGLAVVWTAWSYRF